VPCHSVVSSTSQYYHSLMPLNNIHTLLFSHALNANFSHIFQEFELSKEISCSLYHHDDDMMVVVMVMVKLDAMRIFFFSSFSLFALREAHNQ